jgi:regulator of nucleoside diphosphate kinase
MTLCEPIVSVRDKERVIDRIRHARSSWSTYAPCLDWFQIGLSGRPALPPGEVPGDVITMNSRFELLDLRSGESAPYTLVYPEEESLERGKLCVLSPMGMALLGARVGNIVRWNGTGVPRAAEVLRLLYQPEAAGHHHV